MGNPTTYLKDYQPPVFKLETVRLDFDLYDDYVDVVNRMKLSRMHPGDLRLNGEGLQLVSIHLDDKLLVPNAYRMDGQDLVVPNCPDEATITVVTRLAPQDNTSLSGLYRSNHLFCTQCEAQGFRRMTFFPDRPDVLATYTTRISANKENYPVLLSNGNKEDCGETPDGRHWVIWHDPFKKPSYLFALVAGNLSSVIDEFTTCSGRVVELRIYVEPGNEDKCAHALASLKKAMRWDEEQYGREYDLDVFMIVAVSDFNMGAMENKGLNIFNSKYILARKDTATDTDFADIEGVVAHEYFHNWTGNRVTCRDWFQLSLKEGLTVFRDQEFSRDMNSRDVNRILDVNLLRSTQFPEDAGSMAHPVRPESYQEINNFYTATIYNKGAEVIRMQETLLGKDGFRRGMDLYFERYDGQAVTIDDFVRAMEDANDVDFTQLMRWYSQAGTPEVSVSSDYQAGCLTLTLTQSCKATPECQEKKPFHIPIRYAMFASDGSSIPTGSGILELRKSKETFRFEGLKEQPIVSLLRDFSAPILVRRDVSEEELLKLLRFEDNGFAKWDAAQTLARSCIIQCYHTKTDEWHVPKELAEALCGILDDETIDAALRAQLLTPPGFEEVVSGLEDIDVVRVEKARDFYRERISIALYGSAKLHYAKLWAEEKDEQNGAAFGRRHLRNVCLWLMMKGNEDTAWSQCELQWSRARTMTDALAGLSLLTNSSKVDLRQRALDTFYEKWQHDDLVLDKWFSVQASCELPGTLNEVKRLLTHPAFHMKNPNKVRALIGAFSQGNPRHFHAQDGEGYAFLTDRLITMDPINPQIAARLATPFTRWRRLNAAGRALMQKQLEYLASRELSRDLSELVVKSLND